VRVSSNAKIIADAVNPREAVGLLRRMVALPGHRFWTDDVAPAKQEIFDSVTLVGHRQVTDAYLLALCVAHKGRLATLDRGVPELLLDSRAREAYVELLV
jgi:hypothetical protein